MLVGLVLLGTIVSATADWPDFNGWWDYRNPGTTELRFRELLETGPPDPDYRIQLTTQLARSLGLQGQFDAGFELLATVEPELDSVSDETRVRWLLEQGRLLNSSGSAAQARPLFERAWELGRASKLDGYAADAGHMVAIVAQDSESIEWNERVVEFADASDDPEAQRWLGSLYNNLGWACFEMEDYLRALKAHQAGVAFFETRDEPNRLRIARWSVAKQLRFLGRCAEALAINQELEQEWKSAGEPDGFVHEELGECLLLLGRADEAQPQFARAHQLLSQEKWLVDGEPDRVARLERLGKGKQ